MPAKVIKKLRQEVCSEKVALYGVGLFLGFETKTVMLNSGYEMPIYELNTYNLTGEVCVNCFKILLKKRSPSWYNI